MKMVGRAAEDLPYLRKGGKNGRPNYPRTLGDKLGNMEKLPRSLATLNHWKGEQEEASEHHT